VLLRGKGGAQFIFMSEIGGSGGRAGRGEWNGRKASGVGGHCRMHQATASAGNSYVQSGSTDHHCDFTMFLQMRNVPAL
jgi:hypothetical protein